PDRIRDAKVLRGLRAGQSLGGENPVEQPVRSEEINDAGEHARHHREDGEYQLLHGSSSPGKFPSRTPGGAGTAHAARSRMVRLHARMLEKPAGRWMPAGLPILL